MSEFDVSYEAMNQVEYEANFIGLTLTAEIGAKSIKHTTDF